MEIENIEKLAANFHDIKGCYTHKKLKQALNHGLVLKKGQWVIKFNIKDWLKSCIGMIIELRKNA